jgi:hypothetical protein
VSLRARRHHRTSNALASSPSSRRSTSTYSSIRFNTRPFATFVTACASSPASVYERIDRDRFVRGASSSNASTRPPSPSVVASIIGIQHPNAIPSSHRVAHIARVRRGAPSTHRVRSASTTAASARAAAVDIARVAIARRTSSCARARSASRASAPQSIAVARAGRDDAALYASGRAAAAT